MFKYGLKILQRQSYFYNHIMNSENLLQELENYTRSNNGGPYPLNY